MIYMAGEDKDTYLTTNCGKLPDTSLSGKVQQDELGNVYVYVDSIREAVKNLMKGKTIGLCNEIKEIFGEKLV